MNRRQARESAIDASLTLAHRLDARRANGRERAARFAAKRRTATLDATEADTLALACALDAHGIRVAATRTVRVDSIRPDGSVKLRRYGMTLLDATRVKRANAYLDARPVSVARFMRENGSTERNPGATLLDASASSAQATLGNKAWDAEARVPHGSMFVSSVASRTMESGNELSAWLECHASLTDAGELDLSSVMLRQSWIDADKGTRAFGVACPSRTLHPMQINGLLIDIASKIAAMFSIDGDLVLTIVKATFALPIGGAANEAMPDATTPANPREAMRAMTWRDRERWGLDGLDFDKPRRERAACHDSARRTRDFVSEAHRHAAHWLFVFTRSVVAPVEPINGEAARRENASNKASALAKRLNTESDLDTKRELDKARKVNAWLRLRASRPGAFAVCM